jgi:hypothetical protein
VKSALYEGVVRHARMRPAQHSFERPLFMAYLDLAELDTVFRGRWLWSTRRPAPARFRREDFFGDPTLPLDLAVRERVQAETGRRPEGPIRLLGHLRYFGYAFNPVCFYYCFNAEDSGVEAILAEVTNTPWKESHSYVLSAGRRDVGEPHRFHTPKEFHVSPFMGMNQSYDWSFSEPGERLFARIQNRETGSRRPLFHAELDLERREITGPALARMLVRYPAMTVQVIAAIYGHAIRLRRKGVPEYPHPEEDAASRRSLEVAAR